MNYNKVLQELYSMKEWKFKPGLRNMKILLKKLGNPEKKLKCIHVAGTNGKGSVCAMLSSMLQQGGYKVGLYTSPHLRKFNERIRISNKLISDKEVVEYYLKVKKYVADQSFFEITTAMMFLYFFEKGVDFAVVEVGMGGRLDSTNVITPLISVITNVAYEHEKFLGNRLSKIAYEKCGVIKSNVPVVTGCHGVALETIKRIANERNSPLETMNKNNIKNKRYDKKSNSWIFDFSGIKNLSLNNLKGEFQIKNAIIAVKALHILRNNNMIRIDKKAVKNGLRMAEWPARFELKKNMLVDAAHNPNGFEVLFNELKNIRYNKLIVVAGFSKDKDVKKMSKMIAENADKIILTQANNERAMNIDDAKKYFKNNVVLRDNSKGALEYAKRIAKKDDLVLVAGSIYLAGELL